MKSTLTRRDLLRSGALAAGTFAAPRSLASLTQGKPSADNVPGLRLGLASYTFRDFTRAQMIGFLKQLNVSELNAKDVKDHLPTDPQQEAAALADYATAGIKLHAAGAIYPGCLTEGEGSMKISSIHRRGSSRSENHSRNLFRRPSSWS